MSAEAHIRAAEDHKLTAKAPETAGRAGLSRFRVWPSPHASLRSDNKKVLGMTIRTAGLVDGANGARS